MTYTGILEWPADWWLTGTSYEPPPIFYPEFFSYEVVAVAHPENPAPLEWYLQEGALNLANTGASEFPPCHAYIWATGVTDQCDAEDRESKWDEDVEEYYERQR